MTQLIILEIFQVLDFKILLEWKRVQNIFGGDYDLPQTPLSLDSSYLIQFTKFPKWKYSYFLYKNLTTIAILC